MSSQTRAWTTGWRDSLLDDYVQSYVEWREECDELRDAYQRWADSGPLDRDLAFPAYRAALDREEKAALVYASVVEQVARRQRR